MFKWLPLWYESVAVHLITPSDCTSQMRDSLDLRLNHYVPDEPLQDINENNT